MADQERATAEAIVASFQSNMPLIQAKAAQDIRHQIPERPSIDWTFREYARIARMEQDARDRKNHHWFNNFILDRQMIQDVEEAGTHATAWTRAAEFWEMAYPYRIEHVRTSHSIPDADF